jgi:hypothetical protein
MSTAEHHTTTPASGAGAASKKHTRSRGRSKKAPDPYASTYGVIPFELFGGGPWMPVRDLGEATVGKHVLLFGKVWSVRPVSRTRTVVVLFHYLAASTVRCVVVAGSQEGVTTRTVRFAATLTREAAIDVEGVVSLPEGGRVLGTTQQVEVQVRKIHSIGVNHANKPRGGKLQRSRASVTRGPVKLEEESVVEVEPEGEIVTRGPVKLEESVVEVEPEGEIVTRGPVKLEEESVVEVEPEGEIVRAGQVGLLMFFVHVLSYVKHFFLKRM